MTLRGDVATRMEDWMNGWTVFGISNYLSDVFELIHCNGGVVSRVVTNMTHTETELTGLRRRISLVGYEIPVIELSQFSVIPGEKYCFGFTKDRETLTPTLKEQFRITFATLVHPTAHVGPNVRLGEGVTVGAGVVIAPNCELGDFTQINRAVSLGHDCCLGPYSVINPGVHVAGSVRIGARSMVGIGATILGRLVVGDDSVVGAGSLVVKDVPANVVVVGVPAQRARALD